MIKLLVVAAFAALVTACAAPSPGGNTDPMHGSRGSTPQGASGAALLGFHGPVYRRNDMDGPN
jgi:hypothetical protein